MEAAGASRRVIDVTGSLAGPVTGEIGAATVVACPFCGAISDSGPAREVAVDMLMIPARSQRRYEGGCTSAVTALAGGFGTVVRRSVPTVIFGISALGMAPPAEAVARFGQFKPVSISTLFIAGSVPAFLIADSLLVMNYLLPRQRSMPSAWRAPPARGGTCSTSRRR